MHVIACLRLNFLRLVLAKMRAHSIDERMSFHKALDGAAPRDKIIFAKLGKRFNATGKGSKGGKGKRARLREDKGQGHNKGQGGGP